jgi:hypothetical protein
MTPDLLTTGIPDTFLALKYTDGAGPIIVAVEKSAIHFDPPGTAPETKMEWEVVAKSLVQTLKPFLPDLLDNHDTTRSTESGVAWRHLDLTAALLTDEGIELRTQAHQLLRQSPWR